LQYNMGKASFRNGSIGLLLTFFTCLTMIARIPYAFAQPACNSGPGGLFCQGITAEVVSDVLASGNYRITQLHVMDPSSPTFAVIFVENTGEFASEWWWWWGQTPQQVGQLTTNPNKRIISLEPYQTSTGLRFAVVMVPESGPQNKAWWWYWGQTDPDVGNLCTQNNARLISLRPYIDGGNRLFAVVMVSNTGSDEKQWEWWYGESTAFISGRITSDNMRVTTIVPDPTGGWDTILVLEEPGVEWYWWFGITASQVVSDLIAHGTRLIDISGYLVNGVWYFASVEIGNNQPPQDSEW